MLDETEMSKLLNRSLTSGEKTNFELYLNIATERLEQLVCFSLCDDGGSRTYPSRNNYRDLYIDPFTSIISVTVDDVEVTDYTIKQNGSYNGDWYNVIEFAERQDAERVVVEAMWGYDCMPADLQLLLAKLFSQIAVEQQADDNVKSKKIEDFTVTYKDKATFDEFVSANSATISKYSQCEIGSVDHGRVQSIYF